MVIGAVRVMVMITFRVNPTQTPNPPNDMV